MKIHLEPKDYTKITDNSLMCCMCTNWNFTRPVYHLKDSVRKRLYEMAKKEENPEKAHEKIDRITYLCKKHFREVMGWTWSVS